MFLKKLQIQHSRWWRYGRPHKKACNLAIESAIGFKLIETEATLNQVAEHLAVYIKGIYWWSNRPSFQWWVIPMSAIRLIA